MSNTLNIGSISVNVGDGQIVLTGADGSQASLAIPADGELTLALGLSAATSAPAVTRPSWVPIDAVAWADFKEGNYSAAGGAITTLLGMWDKDYPDPDTFDPSSVQPGIGLVHDTADLTDAASADLLGGFTVVVLAPDVGFPVQVTAYDTGFDFEFYGKLKTYESEMGDYNDLTFDIPTEPGRREMKLTITPEKISMCVDDGPVFTGTPLAGAVFEKINLKASSSTVERILFLPPQDDSALPSLTAAV